MNKGVTVSQVHDEICTEEHYVASLDLLGAKEIILKDKEDISLIQVRNIYNSWVRINKDGYFLKLKIKVFSDNIVVAIKSEYEDAVDNLLEFVSYMAEHFLECGYKPRGGVCKGKLFLDDVFVWGEGLVKAYQLESKKAIYPRIIIDEEVLDKASEHFKKCMVFKDKDGVWCLNYLRSFGKNSKSRIEELGGIQRWVIKDLDELEREYITKKDEEERKEIERKMKKMSWLSQYVDGSLKYWEEFCKESH